MSDEPTSLILVVLRRIDGKLDGLGDDVRDLRDRVLTREHQSGDTRREVLNLAATEAEAPSAMVARHRSGGWRSA